MKASSKHIIIPLLFIILLGGKGNGFGSEALNLTVESAVSTALEENLNLKLQKIEVEVGQGAELMENGVFDPLIEAGISDGEQQMTSLMVGGAENEERSSWTIAVKKKLATGTEMALSWENDRNDTDSGLVVVNPSYSSTVGLSVTQPLMRGNSKESQTAGVRAAEKFTEAAIYMVEDQAASLAANVKKSYWELVYARQDIEVKKRSLQLARNLRDETKSKIESGVLAEVEIYQPDSEIARREEHLIASERIIAEKEDELKLLINIQDWQTSIIPVDTPEIPAQKPDLQDVLGNALARRSDIRASDLQVDAAEIKVGKAVDDLKPSLALGGSAGMKSVSDNYGDALDDTFSNGDFSWQVGLTFQLPIGNKRSRGGLTTARAELAKSRLRAELLRRETVRKSRESVRNVTLALKTIEATRKTSLAAQKRLEAENTKFGVGLATAYDVLVSQDSYAQALISEKRAIVDLAKAQAELDRVQGVVSF